LKLESSEIEANQLRTLAFAEVEKELPSTVDIDNMFAISPFSYILLLLLLLLLLLFLKFSKHLNFVFLKFSF
jgi:hypothetical protein